MRPGMRWARALWLCLAAELRPAGGASHRPFAAPARTPAAAPPSCQLAVLSQERGVLQELAQLAVFVRYTAVSLQAGTQGDTTALDEVTLGLTWVAVHVRGSRRWLQAQELEMLRKHGGQWERWFVLLETHCLLQLQWPDIVSSLVLPVSATAAMEAVVAAGMGAKQTPQVRCVLSAGPDTDLPAIAEVEAAPLPEGHTAGDRPILGLGACPGLLLLPSAPGLAHRRRLLRASWLRDFPGLLRPLGRVREGEAENAESCWDYFFITGWAHTAELRSSLALEREEEADTISDCSMQDAIPHYAGLQHKFFKALVIQQRLFPHAEYIVRASDDTYVHVPRMMGLVDLYGANSLYLGREVSGQKYRDDWTLRAEYARALGHTRLPSELMGDVMVLSEDVVRAMLDARRHLQHWAHFDDTVGAWLSMFEGIRRVGALRSDREWIEWFEVMRGEIACSEGELVVAHVPAWKDWQNAAIESLRSVSQDHRRDEDHGVVLEWMFEALSRAMRSSGDPCLLDQANYQEIYGNMLGRLVEMNWYRGHRMQSQSLDVIHQRPTKEFVGFNAVPVDGVRVQRPF